MGVLRSAGVVSASTLLSRVLGMVRDIAFASLLGAGFTMDAFVVAWRIPNLFRRLMGEGALSSAFIPVFSGEREKNGIGAAIRFFRCVLTLLTVVLAVLTVIGVGLTFLLPPSAFGAGDAAEKADLVLSLLRILFPYVLLINVMALFMAVLNSVDRFFGPAVAPALVNVFWIAGVLLAPEVSGDPTVQVKVVAGAILCGGTAQLLVQLPFLRAADITLRPLWDLGNPALRRMLFLMVPMVFGLAPVQINIILDTLIAEAFVPGDGANSYLFLGNRLVQFPLALIGIAMGIVVFPLFSRLAKAGEREELGKRLAEAVRMTLFLAVPAAIGLLAVATPAVTLLFQWGHFTPEHTRATAGVLTMYSLGVPAYCGLQIMTRFYYALEEVKTPVKVGAAMVAVNLVLNLLLVGPMKQSGLALATSLSGMLNLSVLVLLARRRLGARGLREVFFGNLKSLGLALLMGGVVYGLAAALAPTAEVPSVLERLAWVLPPILAGGLLYLGGARILGLEEARALISGLRR